MRTICNHRRTLSMTASTSISPSRPPRMKQTVLSSSRFEFFPRANLSGLTSPMTSSMQGDMLNVSYASDMRILMENMQALNVNNRGEDHLLTHSTSLKEANQRSNALRHSNSQSSRSNPPSQNPSLETGNVSQSHCSVTSSIVSLDHS